MNSLLTAAKVAGVTSRFAYEPHEEGDTVFEAPNDEDEDLLTRLDELSTAREVVETAGLNGQDGRQPVGTTAETTIGQSLARHL